jgi:hypothetical protein
MATRERIVSLKRTTWDYLEARRIAASSGMRLPSNPLHDEYLRSGSWEEVREIYPAWADEILVHPRLGKAFRRNKDVMDSNEDRLGRKWILPREYVKMADERGGLYGVTDAALLVIPQEVIQNGWRVIVVPETLFILYNVAGLDSRFGILNPATGLPHGVERGNSIPPGMERRLIRHEGWGVRPLIRGAFGAYRDARFDINAVDGWPTFYSDKRNGPDVPDFPGFGVAGAVEEEFRLTMALTGGKLVFEGPGEALEEVIDKVTKRD